MSMIIDELRRTALIDVIRTGKRLSERDFYEYREVEVRKGVITTADGSALARIGNTQILACTKFDIGEPYPDRPNQGVFMTNAEFVPFANPSFEPGPPDENSIELARIVDRGIRSSEIIDLDSFYLEEGKVLMLFIDLWIFDDQGNMIDTSALAAMGALLNTKVPKYEDGQLIRDGDLPNLKLKDVVTAHTFCKAADKTFLDPALDEEVAADGRLTLSVMGDKIVSVQKAGPASFNVNEIFDLMDIAFKKHSELKSLLIK